MAAPMRCRSPRNSSAHPPSRPCNAHRGHKFNRQAGSASAPSLVCPPGVNAPLTTRSGRSAGIPDRGLVASVPPGEHASHKTAVFARIETVRNHRGCADGTSRHEDPSGRGKPAPRSARTDEIRIDIHGRIMQSESGRQQRNHVAQVCMPAPPIPRDHHSTSRGIHAPLASPEFFAQAKLQFWRADLAERRRPGSCMASHRAGRCEDVVCFLLIAARNAQGKERGIIGTLSPM